MASRASALPRKYPGAAGDEGNGKMRTEPQAPAKRLAAQRKPARGLFEGTSVRRHDTS